MKKLILGALLGGVIAFVWSFISWELIGWHEKPFHRAQSDDAVLAVITANTTLNGMYLFPAAPVNKNDKAAMDAYGVKIKQGPFVFAAVKRDGFGSYPKALIKQFGSELIGAFLLTWLLMQTAGLSYPRRVLFVAVAGLAASVIVDIPNYAWWGFSRSYTLVSLVDFTIMWALAGLAIAAVVKPRRIS